jgi:hypothetical protein
MGSLDEHMEKLSEVDRVDHSYMIDQNSKDENDPNDLELRALSDIMPHNKFFKDFAS